MERDNRPKDVRFKTEYTIDKEEESETLQLVEDLIGKEQLDQTIIQEGVISIHNTAETNGITIGDLHQRHPGFKNKLVRSSHTGVLQVLRPKDHRSIFTIHAKDENLPWTNYIYEMTRIPNNDAVTNGADYYYRPDLEVYETENGVVRLEKLDLRLSSGQSVEESENHYLKATPFVFLKNSDGNLVRLSYYWRERIKEIRPESIFAYEEMSSRNQEISQFLNRFLSGVETTADQEEFDKANETLGLLSSRHSVEKDGCYYSNSKLRIKKDKSYELVSITNQNNGDDPEEKTLQHYSRGELIDVMLKGIELPGIAKPLSAEEQEEPIPLLSLDATIALWSIIFSEKYQNGKTLHHYHIHSGGGDMAGMPPLYEGYMFAKNGKRRGRQENLSSILNSYNKGIQAIDGDNAVDEKVHIIMFPARIYDAVFSEDELGNFPEIPNQISQERIKANQSLKMVTSTLDGTRVPDEEDLQGIFPIARKAIRKHIEEGNTEGLERVVDVLKDPMYPFNQQKMQKLIINWACNGDGHQTNRIWRQAIDTDSPNWIPAKKALIRALPPNYAKRVTNHIPSNFTEGGKMNRNEYITEDLDFALDQLSIPLASLLNASIRNILEH